MAGKNWGKLQRCDFYLLLTAEADNEIAKILIELYGLTPGRRQRAILEQAGWT
jgi:hypothetical protein